MKPKKTEIEQPKKQRGNKGSKVLYPNIINEFPTHSVFWELCAGSAEITKIKKKAKFTGLVDINNYWVQVVKNNFDGSAIACLQGCVKEFLKELMNAGKNHLIYIDPPYLHETRPNSIGIYEYEMSFKDHVEMLELAVQSNANIIISHYPCPLYNIFLTGWRTKDINVSYHGYKKTERLYMNFPPAEQLHETTFTGKNKTERQQIKRQAQRWVKRFQNLDPQVKQFIIETLSKQKIIN